MTAEAASVLGVDLELNGKRAIITGGSKGIGLAVARGPAGEGADVVLAARSAGPLEAAAAAVAAETGRRVLAVPTDTGDDDQVRELVRRTVAELGGVDILVNAAATPWSAGSPAGPADTTDEIVLREVRASPSTPTPHESRRNNSFDNSSAAMKVSGPGSGKIPSPQTERVWHGKIFGNDLPGSDVRTAEDIIPTFTDARGRGCPTLADLRRRECRTICRRQR